MKPRWTAAAAGGLIALAAWAAYRAALPAPFFFDDRFAVVENPSIRDLRRIGAVLATSPDASGATGRPLANLTLALNHAAGGLDPRGYHWTNLILHILAAWTLFGLVRRTFALTPRPFGPPLSRGEGEAIPSGEGRHGDAGRGAFAAFVVALLWALHPLQTESVILVNQRGELLASLCCLLSLYAFARGWLAAAWASCLLAMASKEIAAGLPLIVLLYDRAFVAGSFREAWRRRRGFHLAMAAAWLPLAALVLHAGRRAGSAGFGLGVSPWGYLLTQARAIGLYLKLSAWPHPLVADYGTGVARSLGEVAPQAALVLALLASTGLALRRNSPAGFLGAAFFLILAPSSSVVPIVTQTMAEHRMYLPLAAVVALAVGGGLRLAAARAWAIGAAGLAVAAAFALTARRAELYRSEEALWRDVLAKRPDNPRAWLNLGTLASWDGRLDEALGWYAGALERDPGAADIRLYLAEVLERQGRTAEAAGRYREALRLRPDLPAAHYQLGAILDREGDAADAAAEFGEALRLQPGSAKARDGLAAARLEQGNALARQGRVADALPAYEEAARLRPDFAPALNNLGNALSSLGRHAEAIARFEAAVRADPGYAEARFNLGGELLDAGRAADARAQFAEALRLRPDDAQAREQLARIDAMSR